MIDSPTHRRARTRQVIRYLSGVVVVSVGATFGIQSGAGAAPYDALLVTLSDRFGTPFWATAWLVQVVWVAAILRAGGRIRLGALFHSLLFGPIITVALAVIPQANGWMMSTLYLAVSVSGIAVGLWLYLGAAFVSGMVDNLFDTLSRRGDFRTAGIRTVFDIACCAYAWIGGGPVGVGTVIIAFGVGPLLGALSTGMLHPASWRGIRLPTRRIPDSPLELVDTAEYVLRPDGPH
ncbi:membrane protein [soil metagenome]